MIKKIFYALSFVLFSTACNQNDLQEQIPLTDEVQEICATIKEFEFEKSDFSRTSITIEEDGPHYAWAETDTIGIFPNVGRQVEFSMAEGAGSTSAKFTGGGWGLKSTSTYAAYYPLIGQYYLDKTAIPVDYTGQVQDGNGSTAHLGAYDYLAAPASKVNNGTVSFNFERLGCLVQLKLTLPQATTLQSVSLITDSEAFAIKGKVDIMAGTLDIQSVTSKKDITLTIKDVSTAGANQVVTLYMMIPPVDLSGKTLKAVVKTSVNTKEVVLESKNFQAGKAYALSATLNEAADEEIVITGNYSNVTISKASMITYVKLPDDVTVYQAGVYLSTNNNPSNENGQTLAVSANAETGTTEFSFHATELKMNTTYYYRSYVYIPMQGKYYYGKVYTFTTQNIDEVTPGEYIDLGLSVKWASHNMGATSPEQVGDRYAWGELTIYTGDYAYESNGSMIDIGNNICGTSYDVAYVKLGNGWRLPTYNEMTNLFKQCSYAFTTYKGVVGYIVQGTNGNSIFIPYGNTNFYSGYHTDETGYTYDTYGYFAGFMTGQLSTKTGTKGRVHSLMFTDAGTSRWLWYVNGFLGRDVGQSVRPVFTK